MLREFMQYRLEKAGVPKNRMPELESALFESYNRVVNDQPWEPVSKRVRTTLPDARDKGVVVESRIVPGKALAAHFAEDYASNGICCSDRTQYRHVPNLALTTLTNEKGDTLFSGLRHGVIDAYDIDDKRLARLPDAELRTMAGDLLVREGVVESGSEGRERTIDDLVTQIRSNPRSRDGIRRDHACPDKPGHGPGDGRGRSRGQPGEVRKGARRRDGRRQSLFDFVADPGRAPTRDRKEHQRRKEDAEPPDGRVRPELAKGGAVELEVRDHEGRPRTVTANVNVRQFNFGVNAGAVQGLGLKSATVVPSHAPGLRHHMGWGFAMTDNDPNLRKLLGPPGSGWLEGDVAARAHSMLEQARELNEGRLSEL